MSVKEAILNIEKQVQNTPKHQIFVLEIESINFKQITVELQSLLESFPYLQYLSINNCGLDSLENFPKLPSLIRLDLISNNLKNDFSHLKRSKYIQTLFLSANQITQYENLDSLNFLSNLFQLDLIANPITAKSDYTDQIFQRFPSLKFLDSRDKNGSQSNQANMAESLQRIRPDLFVKGKSLENLYGFEEQKKEKTDKKQGNLVLQLKKQEKSEDQEESKEKKKVIGIRRTHSFKNKSPSKITQNLTTSQKSGLLFNVTRVRRQLKARKICDRCTKTGCIFLTSVLQYVCAELLELAGNKAIEEKLKRILPRHLYKTLKEDKELDGLYENAIIPESEFMSKLCLSEGE